MNKKRTTEQFVERANLIHGIKFNYSFTNYINSTTKVNILCLEHGLFSQTPSSHLSGRGCKDCQYKLISSKNQNSKKKHIICKCCKIKKTVSEFKFRKDSNRYRNVCKKCMNQQNNKLNKKRLQTDSLYKLKITIKDSIRKAIKQNNYKKESKTVDILGCSFVEFKLYIESKFESWMNWKNHGIYNKNKATWQLDHIIPISSAKTIEDIIKLNHYSNFQPLETLKNILKSNRI